MNVTGGRIPIPQKKIQIQKPMLRVCAALFPVLLAGVYFYGWRCFVLVVVMLLFAMFAEALFTFPQGKPVTSAVWVTALIFSLSLPPSLPFWMAVIGILAAVILGKMVFGGFGRNIFNPAMVGRCFLYITFPAHMTNFWPSPFSSGVGGFLRWSASMDGVTGATPLELLKQSGDVALKDLFFGFVPGSLGETSALLILAGGIYLIIRKTAPWRLALSCLLGGGTTGLTLHSLGMVTVPSLLETFLAGSFLFGAFFVVTEPVTGPKTKFGQWIYGGMIGILIVVLRGFSNFSEGVMFSVLIMNAFVPLLDSFWRRLFSRTGEGR